MYWNMKATTEEAKAAAYAEFIKRQCQTGRHTVGCPHRTVSPWVVRAILGTLTAKELGK